MSSRYCRSPDDGEAEVLGGAPTFKLSYWSTALLGSATRVQGSIARITLRRRTVVTASVCSYHPHWQSTGETAAHVTFSAGSRGRIYRDSTVVVSHFHVRLHTPSKWVTASSLVLGVKTRALSTRNRQKPR